MAVKTVDRTFLKGQSVELFRAAIKSQATCDPYKRRILLTTNSVIARHTELASVILPVHNVTSAIIQ